MLFRIKTSLALNVLLALLICAATATLVAGQTSSGGNASGANEANPITIDKAAIQEEAAKGAAEKVAQKEAETDAAKRAAKKAEFEKNPLSVACIEPYVEKDKKGTCDPRDASKTIPGKAGMGDRISIAIPRLSEAAEYKLVDPSKLVLFIDGRVFKDVSPESVGYDSVVYKLERTKGALDAWNGLLGSPTLEPIKSVAITVGYADQTPLEFAKGFPKQNLKLIVYRKGWAVVSLFVLVALVLAFWKFHGRDMLRDSGPPKAEPGTRPYSLAKVQVAWWFTLVVGCFILIYLITGEFTMTEQALVLIGIGTGTALGSAMIDSSKRVSSNDDLETLTPQLAKLDAEIVLLGQEVKDLDHSIAARKTAIAANPAAATETEKESLKTDQESSKAKTIELAEKNEKRTVVGEKIEDARTGLTRPTSGGIWSDLVTDANGPSFHRFQMIAWTVILGILFLGGVYKNLAMPEFSGTMLALMGISAGTYLGFKIPEKQATGDPAAQAPAAQPPPAGAAPQGQPAAAAAQAQPAAAQAQPAAAQAQPNVAGAQVQQNAEGAQVQQGVEGAQVQENIEASETELGPDEIKEPDE